MFPKMQDRGPSDPVFYPFKALSNLMLVDSAAADYIFWCISQHKWLKMVS
jgi:hypothetical protein